MASGTRIRDPRSVPRPCRADLSGGAAGKSLAAADRSRVEPGLSGVLFLAPVTRENIFRRQAGYDGCVGNEANVASLLRDRGFTHVLLAEAVTPGGIQFDPLLSRLVDTQLAAEQTGQTAFPSFQLLTDYEILDADGTTRRYRLLKLN